MHRCCATRLPVEETSKIVFTTRSTRRPIDRSSTYFPENTGHGRDILRLVSEVRSVTMKDSSSTVPSIILTCFQETYSLSEYLGRLSSFSTQRRPRMIYWKSAAQFTAIVFVLRIMIGMFHVWFVPYADGDRKLTAWP